MIEVECSRHALCAIKVAPNTMRHIQALNVGIKSFDYVELNFVAGIGKAHLTGGEISKVVHTNGM